MAKRDGRTELSQRKIDSASIFFIRQKILEARSRQGAFAWASGQQADFVKSRLRCFGAELFDAGSDLPDHFRAEKSNIALPGKIRQR